MTKMALKVTEKDIAETEDIPIVDVTSIDIVSNIKGYHVYKSVWTPTLQEQLYGEIESHNPSINMLSPLKRMKSDWTSTIRGKWKVCKNNFLPSSC